MTKNIPRIPSINVSCLLAWSEQADSSSPPPPEDVKKVCTDIGCALETVGFFNATGAIDPGLTETLVDATRRVLDRSRDFYNNNQGTEHSSPCDPPLPDGVFPRALDSPCYRGFSELGCEKTEGRRDWKEGFDLGVDIAPPPCVPTTNDDGSNRSKPPLPMPSPSPPQDDGVPWVLKDGGRWTIMGVNPWPHSDPVEGIANRYLSRCAAVGTAVMRAIAIHLGLEHNFFVSRFAAFPGAKEEEAKGAPCHLARLLRYPPVAEIAPLLGDKDRLPDGRVQGIGEHSDYGCLAILWQSQGGGLEALAQSGEWVPVPVVRNALVVNIGDCLQTWTKGRIRATKHRVLRSPDEGERFSFPFFFEPCFDAIIEPVPGIAPREGYSGRSETFHYGHHVVEAYARSFPAHPTARALRAAQQSLGVKREMS